jgi:uncharacterized protein YaaQ
MSAVLFGRSLIWSCHDVSGIVSAATASILKDLLQQHSIRPWRLSTTRAGFVENANTDLVLGLSIWRLSRIEDLRPVALAVDSCRRRTPRPICVVYCELPLQALVPILCESGAQLVVSSVPSLQQCIERNINCIPLARQGFHPLTSGLVERLPWSSLTGEDESD